MRQIIIATVALWIATSPAVAQSVFIAVPPELTHDALVACLNNPECIIVTTEPPRIGAVSCPPGYEMVMRLRSWQAGCAKDVQDAK